ncbi:MAG: thioesterase family protein [Ferruginibacter sp.]
MEAITVKSEIRWADIDANFHVLHSKYYDYCADARMKALSNAGISMQLIQQYGVGPVLLREECVFKRELKFGDEMEVRIFLQKASDDFSRWSFVNEIWKNKDTLAAVVTVDGAWIDVARRKLVSPPEPFQNVFKEFPRLQNPSS